MGCPNGSENTNRALSELLLVLNLDKHVAKGFDLGEVQDSQPIYAISLLRQLREELKNVAAAAAQIELPDDAGPTPGKFVEMHYPELPMKAVSCPTVKPRPKFGSPEGDYFRVLKPGETMDMFCTAANGGIRLKNVEELAASAPLRIPHGEETWMRVNSSCGWEWWIDAAGKSYYFNPSTKEIKYSWAGEEINAILGLNMLGESSTHEHEPGTVFTLGSYEALVKNSSSN